MIINGSNINEYIKNNDKNKFIVKIIEDSEFVNELINNNLYWKNFETIGKYYGKESSFEIFKILCSNDINNKFINEEMYVLFDDENYFADDYAKILKYLEYYDKLDMKFIVDILINKCRAINFELLQLLLNSDKKHFIKDNLKSILKNCYCLFEFKKFFKDDKELLNQVNSFIIDNPKNLIYEMMMKGFGKSINDLEKEKIFDMINIIVNELLVNEKLNYSDIELLGSGACSFVFLIGSKVLKLGLEREKLVMDNNKRFLKPLLRTNIDSILDGGILGCVEITEKADTNGITEEDVYLVYKELRDLGYIWVDCRKANLGRLINKNKIYYNDLEPVSSAVNYKTESDEILDEGELVIIDNDLIFKEEEFYDLPPNIRYAYESNIEDYELKYKRDKVESGKKK